MGLTTEPRYDRVTELYAEMEICSELRNCWHWEFKSQSIAEQIKWFAYREMKIKSDNHFEKKRIEEAKKKQSRVSKEIKTKGRVR